MIAKVVTTAENVNEYADGKSPAITSVNTDNTNAKPILSLRSIILFHFSHHTTHITLSRI